jgi:hypothetical protein
VVAAPDPRQQAIKHALATLAVIHKPHQVHVLFRQLTMQMLSVRIFAIAAVRATLGKRLWPVHWCVQRQPLHFLVIFFWPGD